jgi:hypothetical protein
MVAPSFESNAKIHGVVEFRAGDGPMVRIPEGPAQIELADDSAVIHWVEDGVALNAAIPLIEYQEHVDAGRISR